MFGNKLEKKIIEIDPRIEIKEQINPNEKEDFELCKSLGLIRQQEIIKIEQLGYKCIRRNDCSKLLGFDTKESLSSYDIQEFTCRIPKAVLCKISDLLEKPIFDNLYIIAPTDISSQDPLLIGEKYTSEDNIIHNKEDYPELKKYGYRNGNFWHRDSLVFLIAKWE